MYKEIASNKRRTLQLFFFFGLLVIGIGWGLSYYYNESAILLIAVILVVGQSWISYFFSDSIIRAVAGAKLAPRQEFTELHRLVENVAITCGLPKPQIYVVDDPAPNAFATGRNPEHGSVVFTTGILQLLDKRELEGVVAHELAHIGNRDTLVMTVAVTMVGVITLVSDIFLRTRFWGSSDDNNRGGGYAALIAIVLAILAPLSAKLIELALSRQREYLADASAALATRFPDGLASALEKLERYERPMRAANRATAHLYINEPFGVKDEQASWLSRVFSTHPPIADRVTRLKAMTYNG